jgi:hypothetical protein
MEPISSSVGPAEAARRLRKRNAAGKVANIPPLSKLVFVLYSYHRIAVVLASIMMLADAPRTFFVLFFWRSFWNQSRLSDFDFLARSWKRHFFSHYYCYRQNRSTLPL